jgi:hypothetical protein
VAAPISRLLLRCVSRAEQARRDCRNRSIRLAWQGTVGECKAAHARVEGRKKNLKTRIYLTSGGKEYVSDGRPGSHSPFAFQFLAALRTYGGADAVLDFDDIKKFVEQVTLNQPRFSSFGDAEPGSDFWFFAQ